MRKLLAALVLGLFAIGAQADNYYAFDGTNDTMTGSFTSTYSGSTGISIGAWIRTANHPGVVDVIVTLGASNSAQSEFLGLSTTTTDNQWRCIADDAGASSIATATKAVDNTWVPYLCVFTSDTSRDIYFSDQTANNTTSRTVTALQHLRVGENMVAGADWVGDIAYLTVWDAPLSGADITSFLGGTCPATLDSGNVIGSYPFQSSNSTQANEGLDATGDLTVSGATFVSTGGPGISCGTAPAFSVSPTAAPAANGVTISGTATGTATITVKAVGVAPGDGIPTCTQIQAGQNDGGTAALATGSDTWVDTVSDSFTATGTNPVPIMDWHVCARNGIGDSSVVSLPDEDRSPDSGQEIVVLTSLSATGLGDCADCYNGGSADARFDPDVAIGDAFEHDAKTNESANCEVNIGTDGDLEFNPLVGGACDGRKSFEISYEDVSSATTALFTAPSTGNFTTDDTLYADNGAPDCPLDPLNSVIVLTEDVAMEAIDLKVLGQCADAEDDLLTFTVTVGTLPVGTALSGTGNKDWTGTPTTEDEAGEALTIRATDIALDFDEFSLTSYVVNTWTVTDLDGLTVTQAEAAVVVDAPWREFDPGITIAGTECSEETAGTIVSQDPAANTEATASQTIEVMLAVSCGDPATERKVVFVLTDLTGLVRWVDYIPVSEVIGCDAGRYEENGCWATLPLASDSGKVAWVDYIPVGEVSPDTTGKWRYENNGWIPVDDLTP